MEILEKAVNEEKHQNANKEENARNKYDADSVEMCALDEEIKKYVEHDQNECIKHNMNLNENIDDNSNKTEDKSEEEQNACNKEIDYDLEEERNVWRLLHPDENSDSDCSISYSNYDSETSMLSTHEKWLLRNQKLEEQGQVMSE